MIGLIIDGDNQTYWQSPTSGVRSIIFQVRDYPKRLEGIRLRTPQADDRSQIQDVTIKAARNLATIDEAGNIVASGVDFTYVDSAWSEYAFVANRKRYLKLEFATSIAGNNVRIRSLEVRVGVTTYD